MVIGFCTGVCNGFALPVAQMFGAKNEQDLRRFVANGAWSVHYFFRRADNRRITGLPLHPEPDEYPG